MMAHPCYASLLALISLTYVENLRVNVSIDTTQAFREVNERFVSVAFGASMIDYDQFPLKTVLRSKKLITLSSALAPAYLRLGGNMADFLTFDPESGRDRRLEIGDDARKTRPFEEEERSSGKRTEDVASKSAKELAAYWYRCGCESEMPRMDVYRRDRSKVAEREQRAEIRDQSSKEERERAIQNYHPEVEVADAGTARVSTTRGTERNITMTGDDWDEINGFARATGLRLLFDVNVLKRTPRNEWNSSNAASLLRYGARRNYSLDFQLGNEPNHFPYRVHRTVAPEQLAHDFQSFRRLLRSGIGGGGGGDSASSLLVGPDVTRPKNKPDLNYLKSFLKDGIAAVDAVTWHQYYLNGRTATLRNFTDPKVLNVLRSLISRVADARDATGGGAAAAKKKPIWMTETASAYGGGACGLSDRFADGFFWLDKLGTAAAMGVDVVTRQTLWKGQYGLLDGDLTFNPRPDYWLTLLFKRLVGRKVLKVIHDGEGGRDCSGHLRLFAHCAAPAAAPSTGGAAVTLFGVNLMREEAILRLENVARGVKVGEKTTFTVKKYVLEADRGDLSSKLVRLNARKIRMRREDALPPLSPVVETFRDAGRVELRLPKFAMAFFVVDGLDAKACGK